MQRPSLRTEQLVDLVRELISLPHETSWLEMKENNDTPEMISEYISALFNSATLEDQDKAYLIWGIRDGDQGKPIVLLEINAATAEPTSFRGAEYIRIGSYKKRLKDHREHTRRLRLSLERKTFEDSVALANASTDDVTPIYVLTSGANVPDIKRALDLLDCSPPIRRPSRTAAAPVRRPAGRQGLQQRGVPAGLPRARHQADHPEAQDHRDQGPRQAALRRRTDLRPAPPVPSARRALGTTPRHP